MTTAYNYAQQHAANFRDQLIDWLKIPSVSTDPLHKADIQSAANWLAADMRRIGLNNVQILPTDGHPVVYADWLEAGADAPTVLVYGHYDVQPAVIEDGWDGDPFTPRTEGDKLYARGATDDKGQVMIQMKAAEAMLETGNCPVNLKYLIEGEEEIGSPHLADFIKAHKEMLAADMCVISDTTIKSVDQPSLVYSLRGLVTMEVVVTGPKHDLHSGGYGGMIHNPAQAIAEIITTLHNDDGSVAVPGFYDDVLELDESERQELAKGDVTPAEWEAIMGSLPDWGEPGYSKTERLGARPTLEINGVSGGYAGEGFKTVLPAKAMAKISCRLVANQDPYDIFEKVSAYLRSVAPPTVHLDIHAHGHGYPALTPLDHPAMQAAKRAYKRNWEADPLYMRGGGSIPVVADFQNLLEIPVVLLGFGLPDCAAHGPNESFDLRLFRKGVDTVIAYMHELAENH